MLVYKEEGGEVGRLKSPGQGKVTQVLVKVGHQ